MCKLVHAASVLLLSRGLSGWRLWRPELWRAKGLYVCSVRAGRRGQDSGHQAGPGVPGALNGDSVLERHWGKSFRVTPRAFA